MSGHGKWWGQHPWRGGHQTPHRQRPTGTSLILNSTLLHWFMCRFFWAKLELISSILLFLCCTQSQWMMFVLWPTCLAALLNEAMVFSLIRWCLENVRQNVNGDAMPNVQHRCGYSSLTLLYASFQLLYDQHLLRFSSSSTLWNRNSCHTAVPGWAGSPDNQLKQKKHWVST